MPDNFILFDLDGVLLSSHGYHKALQKSLTTIASSLGLKNTEISLDQIAKFETRNVTNEWDIIAICTALCLIYVWKQDGSIRLQNEKKAVKIRESGPDIDKFLEIFTRSDDLPSIAAFNTLVANNPGLSANQVSYLYDLLSTCRDIYKSPTLPIHQEFILGSQLFHQHYKLDPKLNIEGYLQRYDQPLLSPQLRLSLENWLRIPGNYAGIMTNRQSQTPQGYLSSPEAEIGIKIAGIEGFPSITSGLLAWFAVTELGLPSHTLLKPNPVHALSLLRLLKGEDVKLAIRISSELWNGNSKVEAWMMFQDAHITVYEDSVKGLQSVKTAQSLLFQIGIETKLKLIGVSNNPIKIKALENITHNVISHINETFWPENES